MARPKKVFTEFEKNLIMGLYQEGKTDKEVAKIVGMPRTTFIYALKTNDLIDTIKKAKEKPDEEVEKSLFKRATGYKYNEEKTEQFATRIRNTTTIKEVPPDVTACIFWLCNRMPERWRNKQQVEYKGELFKQIIIVTHQGMEDKLGKRLGESENRA